MTVPLNIRDGVPLCPCCGEPMVEVQPKAWQCAAYAALSRQLAQRLAEAFDREMTAGPEA